MNYELITSVQNPRIKQLLALQQKSSERRKTGLFVVEGQRELQHCIDAGLQIDTIFWCQELSPQLSLVDSMSSTLEGGARGGLVVVNQYLYSKIAYRGSTEGIIAIVHAPTTSLSTLNSPSGEMPVGQRGAASSMSSTLGGGVRGGLYVVLERVEKPGNLGAILRSADAAGVDAVIVCDPLTDLYNPNLIRSSIGAIFTVPTVACTSEECIAWLKQHNVQILTAQLQDSKVYYDTDMTRPTAIVMGTESTGLTPIWREAADAHIRIPMLGRLDSLNVSVSAAILMFEAVRQRQQPLNP